MILDGSIITCSTLIIQFNVIVSKLFKRGSLIINMCNMCITVQIECYNYVKTRV